MQGQLPGLGLYSHKHAFARALIVSKGLQLGNLEGSGCFHSLSPRLFHSCFLSLFPSAFLTHALIHAHSLILIFLAVFLAPSPFGGCEHYP